MKMTLTMTLSCLAVGVRGAPGPTARVPVTQTRCFRVSLANEPPRGKNNNVVTAKLICVFVIAYADCWFPHEAAHM